ncbi:MAG: NAD(+) kinase [Deltaproteobacteria bacterium CG_4_9_14_3_um_filter_63_12]|nr:MAG: NAD(+) kinase [Deltaproteobacteria bacterium CG_4_9_14_3_um_filter_63_12]
MLLAHEGKRSSPASGSALSQCEASNDVSLGRIDKEHKSGQSLSLVIGQPPMSPSRMNSTLQPPSHPRVLLVYKHSLYQLYVQEHHDERITELVSRDDVSVASLRGAHRRQKAALERVTMALKRAPIALSMSYRGELPAGELSELDLVVVLGGDGTLLEASHHVSNIPILGINSDPQTSVGSLCSVSVEQVEEVVESYLSGKLEVQELTRLQLTVNDQLLGPPVLNDILFTHECPAATSSYLLSIRGREESQKSSGVWFSTAAGSTAAIHSAGGQIMALDDRRMQYWVRELYVSPGRAFEHYSGLLEPDEVVSIIPKMRTGWVYLDGPHLGFPASFGDRIAITTSNSPLRRVQAQDWSRKLPVS